ncbi:hypothetical protein I41_13340 [Lacipirellula limnantheis]|uniref:Uncharacterized protein n=1 Tax=Lacipirellula limnantheis TaxID=2528024 RepID=A0A517TUY4_9BACT|nr:hypothetical protein I41_13340 [Lacipirellula limnantheis]
MSRRPFWQVAGRGEAPCRAANRVGLQWNRLGSISYGGCGFFGPAREFCFCVRVWGAPLMCRKSLPFTAGREAFWTGVSGGFPIEPAQKTGVNFAFSRRVGTNAKVARLPVGEGRPLAAQDDRFPQRVRAVPPFRLWRVRMFTLADGMANFNALVGNLPGGGGSEEGRRRQRDDLCGWTAQLSDGAASEANGASALPRCMLL